MTLLIALLLKPLALVALAAVLAPVRLAVYRMRDGKLKRYRLR